MHSFYLAGPVIINKICIRGESRGGKNATQFQFINARVYTCKAKWSIF
jgi:hypothetical protein